MLLSALIYTTLKVVKNMTVFLSLILILRRSTEMGLLSIYKLYNFKGSIRYDRFYVIDFNFAKVY